MLDFEFSILGIYNYKRFGQLKYFYDKYNQHSNTHSILPCLCDSCSDFI